MRVLPYFAGIAVIVAIGGAVAGAAIDTTPREIFDSSHLPTPSSDIDMTSGKRALTANHYPLETDGETYDVAELRERGLYRQKRYADAFETYEPAKPRISTLAQHRPTSSAGKPSSGAEAPGRGS